MHHLLPPLLLGRWGFCSCLHLLHLISFSIHSPKQISNQAKTKHPFINKLNVPQTKVLQAPILSLPKLSKHHFSKHRQAPDLLSSSATRVRGEVGSSCFSSATVQRGLYVTDIRERWARGDQQALLHDGP